MKSCRAAVVGHGAKGAWHANMLRSIPEIELLGVYDILEERQEAARRAGFQTYPSFEAILEDDSLDFVSVVIPNSLHKSVCIALLNAGKNVVSEKPVTLDSAGLEEVLAAAEQHKVLFTAHHNRRLNEDFRIIQNLLRSNQLGKVTSIESRTQDYGGIPNGSWSDFSSTWRNKKEYGGGMVYDWGAHLLDQILMLREQRVVSVYAELTYITTREVDDGFRVLLEFEDGVRALVDCGSSNFIALPRWYVAAENGAAVITEWEDGKIEGKVVMVEDWQHREAVLINPEVDTGKKVAPRDPEYIREYPLERVSVDMKDYYRNIAAVLRGEARPMVSHAQLRRIMKLLDAVFESARENKVVKEII